MNPINKLILLLIGAGVCLPRFEVSAAIVLTNVVSFDGTNGQRPLTLIQTGDGNFYGTTSSGGLGAGDVFKMTPDGSLSTLVSFDGITNYFPGVLLQSTNGDFYGTTFGGGPFGDLEDFGAVFKLTPQGSFTNLHFFDCTNGCGPSGLIQARDGNFYGITANGGSNYDPDGDNGNGVIFKVDTNGNYTVLVQFAGTNGSFPTSLIQGQNGDFYGATAFGGIGFSGNQSGYGTIFKMKADGTLSTLVWFEGTNGSCPGTPFGLIQVRDGSLYGVTPCGGQGFNGHNQSGLGVAFKIDTNIGLVTLVAFDGTNGSSPSALVEGSDGNLYGASFSGLFKLVPGGALTLLASLSYATGLGPEVSFIQATDGNFYGTATSGGAFGPPGIGYGTVFRLSVPLSPVLQLPTQTDSLLNLSWTSVAGQSYQLQYNLDLGSTNWNNLGGPNVATNGVMSALDAIGPDAQRFYRVGVLP